MPRDADDGNFGAVQTNGWGKFPGRGLLVAAGLLLPAVAPAALEWETKVLTVRPKATDEALDVAFHYKNTGTSHIHLLEIETSCGCTTARFAKKTSVPGMEGEIAVHFEVRDRTGPLEEIVTVHTDDPGTPTTELILRAIVPPRIEVSTQLLRWERNETPAAKEIILRAAEGIEFRFLEPQSPDSNFVVETNAEKPGRLYRIHVTPKATTAAAQMNFEIKLEANVGHPQTLSFFALVR